MCPGRMLLSMQICIRNRELREDISFYSTQGSEYYEATKDQALKALKAYPGGLQVGGGITSENAAEFIEAGAAAVIVTSYVFKDGTVNYENLDKIYQTVGREHLVLDLSCRYSRCRMVRVVTIL